MYYFGDPVTLWTLNQIQKCNIICKRYLLTIRRMGFNSMKLHSRFRQVYDSKKALEVPPEGIHKSNNSVRRFSQLSISYSLRSRQCSRGWECNFELGLFWQLWFFFINIQHVILSERGRTADDEVPPPPLPYTTGGVQTAFIKGSNPMVSMPSPV